MLLDHWAESFHKWLAMFKNLKLVQQCPLKIGDKKLLEKYIQIWKTFEKYLKIKSDREPAYGDNDKYIKTKIKVCGGSVNTSFLRQKNAKRKSTMYVFINNNARFCCQSKKKYYPQTLLEECKYEPKNVKMGNLIEYNLEKSSSDETDSEADNDFNDETESDDESNE